MFLFYASSVMFYINYENIDAQLLGPSTKYIFHGNKIAFLMIRRQSPYLYIVNYCFSLSVPMESVIGGDSKKKKRRQICVELHNISKLVPPNLISILKDADIQSSLDVFHPSSLHIFLSTPTHFYSFLPSWLILAICEGYDIQCDLINKAILTVPCYHVCQHLLLRISNCFFISGHCDLAYKVVFAWTLSPSFVLMFYIYFFLFGSGSGAKNKSIEKDLNFRETKLIFFGQEYRRDNLFGFYKLGMQFGLGILLFRLSGARQVLIIEIYTKVDLHVIW
ncbi:hypothetical protein ACJX0J_029093 [Zea mays]